MATIHLLLAPVWSPSSPERKLLLVLLMFDLLSSQVVDNSVLLSLSAGQAACSGFKEAKKPRGTEELVIISLWVHHFK